MKNISSIILSCLLLSACADKKEPVLIDPEYQYPRDSLLNGKKFHYSNGKGEVQTDIIQSFKEGTGYRIIKKRLSNNTLTDSSIILNNRLLEQYDCVMEPGTKVKGKILLDSLFTERGLVKSKIASKFEADSFSINVAYQTQFEKDTTITFESKSYPSKMYRTSLDVTFRQDTSSHTWHVDTKQYYGKGIGILILTSAFTNLAGLFDYSLWTLKEIETL